MGISNIETRLSLVNSEIFEKKDQNEHGLELHECSYATVWRNVVLNEEDDSNMLSSSLMVQSLNSTHCIFQRIHIYGGK